MPDNKASSHLWQCLIDLKEEIDKYTVIGRDINTSLLVTDRSSRQKVSKYMHDWKSTINMIDLIYIYAIYFTHVNKQMPVSSLGSQ